MNDFNFVGAWARGYRFVTARPLAHGALLIGLGLLVPAALQYTTGQYAAGMGRSRRPPARSG